MTDEQEPSVENKLNWKVKMANRIIAKAEESSGPINQDQLICRITAVAVVLHLALDHGSQALLLLAQLI